MDYLPTLGYIVFYISAKRKAYYIQLIEVCALEGKLNAQKQHFYIFYN